MKLIDAIGLTSVEWVFLLEVPSILWDFHICRETVFFTLMRLFTTQMSQISGGTRQREKKNNFTHRCKSLNCLKPSVTWEELLYIWKQRLEVRNMSDKKSWNLQSYLAVHLISRNWSVCSAILAQWQSMPVKAIVYQKLVKILLPMSVWPVQQSGCSNHWRL